METVNIERQGDVYLVPIVGGVCAGCGAEAHIPPQLVPAKGDLIIQEGEATGHAHRIRAPHSATMWEQKREGKFVAVMEQPEVLTHEDHGTKTVPVEVGKYHVHIRRVYDYEAEMERAVVD